ncbi:MAG TPA: DEAD/DEAH box helicase, partial [Gemmatimonadaceae bacterium]|nr:DEAD/DEAH box helicase [Gemmatimonadaceae bacterium]
MPDETSLGTITLHRHQLSALRRLDEAIDEFNGALFCDEVGMGKTYVALAVSRRYSRRLIVAPAALVSMWEAALSTAKIEADILSFETLSRADVDAYRSHESRSDGPRTGARAPDRATSPHRQYDFIIVDEAHHVRTPLTNRYFALENLVRDAKVLLLSATPIHNRRADLVALLALFMGSRAGAMTAAELSKCLVRREHKQLGSAVHIPSLLPTVSHEVGDDPELVDSLMSLPPPVPVRDGGIAGVLISRGLVHQWASSEAALCESVRKRIARAVALCVSLETGTYPTLRELETWIYHDGALQLAFAELLSAPVIGHEALLDGVRAHLAALEVLRSRFSSMGGIDTERARIVSHIRGERTVAFAQYAETIATLYRRLARHGRVAMLTSHGARVAGGTLARDEAIARFAPLGTGSTRPPPAEAIELLLTTDLLSEGVNLQDASTVIHLDVPWTAARMEQRVGRVARLGSAHSRVVVHLIRPPASAAAVLRAEPTVQHKWSVARANVGTSGVAPLPPLTLETPTESAPTKVEHLRTVLESWRSNFSPAADSVVHVGIAEAGSDGFIAAVSTNGAPQLIAGIDGRVSMAIDDLIALCTRKDFSRAAADPEEISATLEIIQRWITSQRAAKTAGVITSTARDRRRIGARIDSLIESAPPHLRNSRISLATRARKVVTAPQCSAVEKDLRALLDADLPDDEWLAAIAALETRQAHSASSGTVAVIHAVLLLKRR